MKKQFLLLLIPLFSLAQNANRKYLEHQWSNNSLEIKTSDGVYFIKAYSNQITETTFVPNGQTKNATSHAVVLDAPFVAHFSETKTSLSLSTNQIGVQVIKNPFQIVYKNQEKKILSEKRGYIKKDSIEILDFNLEPTEVLYGGGSRALGMDRRGHRLALYNKANYGYQTKAELMNFCIPLVLSSKKYGVHFDNPSVGFLDLDSKKNNVLQYETHSGRKTYQVIVGNSWLDLISNYTSLTGKQPLPARWVLGNFSSRFGYHSQEEVEKTIAKFAQDSIPLDAVILDLFWFGKTIKGTMGNLEFDKETFPDPTQMMSRLKQKGIQTILITEPFILSTSHKWQEAVDKEILATTADGKPATFDFYFGNTGIIDVFKPEAKTWFWDIYKKLIAKGAGGLWGDLGEPEVFPSTVRTVGGAAHEVHNIYGHTWAKLIQQGYKKDFPEQRPFILMRAGYSGSQRFGIIPWSGDVSRSWGGLQSQPEIALQMGMQGMAYMHSDLGGFAGDYFDNELYIRWLQYGVFQPLFRPHAQEEVASEPVYKDIATKAKVKKQIELRYQMLPYNYNMAFENNQKGIPLMRPLFFEEPDNAKLAAVCKSYLWGNNFLVTPITAPGVKKTLIYFPKNSSWFDFYSGKKITGGTSQKIAVTTDHIPVFVRGDCFIPLIKTIQNTSQYSLKAFDLHFYFDKKRGDSKTELYTDDGKTPDAFEKGLYEIVHFSSKSSPKRLHLKWKSEIGKAYAGFDKNINLILHNTKTKTVLIDGKIHPFTRKNNTTIIAVSWQKATKKDIQIQL